MEKNKTGKYLKYAIGEIVLVVIGILIALQINNWNQQRKERDQEQKLLIQLKNEYNSNLEQLDSKIATRKFIIQSAQDLLFYIDHPQTAIEDSVLTKISNMGLATTFDPIENDLVKSGSMSIIKSERLKQLLTKWSTDVIQVKEAESIYWNHWHYEFNPIFNKSGWDRSRFTIYWKNIGNRDYLLNNDMIESYDFGKSKHAVALSELLNMVELESIATIAIGNNTFSNLESYTLRKQIIEILTILNQEISKD